MQKPCEALPSFSRSVPLLYITARDKLFPASVLLMKNTGVKGPGSSYRAYHAQSTCKQTTHPQQKAETGTHKTVHIDPAHHVLSTTMHESQSSRPRSVHACAVLAAPQSLLELQMYRSSTYNVHLFAIAALSELTQPIIAYILRVSMHTKYRCFLFVCLFPAP